MRTFKHTATLIVLVFMTTLGLLPTPAAQARTAPQVASFSVAPATAASTATGIGCPKVFCDPVVNSAKAIEGATVGKVKNSIDAATNTVKAIKDFSPSNIAESWAQQMAESAVGMMGKAQGWIEAVHKPAFDTQWFAKQYAVMFGLSLIIFAFMLTWVGAKVADSRNGMGGGLEMVKEAGFKIWAIPLVLALGPALLSTFSDVATALSRVFGDEAGKDAGDSMTALTMKMQSFSNGFGSIGGAVVAMVVFLLVILAMIALIVTMAIASWGINILALILPLVVVLYINPKWRDQFYSLFGLLLTLLLMPAFVNLVFWVFWGSVKNFDVGKDMLSNAIFVLVGAGFLAAAPMLSVWLIPKVVPAAGSMSELPQPSMANSAFGPAKRLHDKMSMSGGGMDAGGGSGGDSPSSAGQPSFGGKDESSNASPGSSSGADAGAEGGAADAVPEVAAAEAVKQSVDGIKSYPLDEAASSHAQESEQEQRQPAPPHSGSSDSEA